MCEPNRGNGIETRGQGVLQLSYGVRGDRTVADSTESRTARGLRTGNRRRRFSHRVCRV